VTGDVIAKPSEKEGAEHDQSFFVVDEENVFAVGGVGRRRRDERSGVWPRGFRSGKIEKERSALTGWL
jgi:hypothetical protein